MSKLRRNGIRMLLMMLSFYAQLVSWWQLQNGVAPVLHHEPWTQTFSAGLHRLEPWSTLVGGHNPAQHPTQQHWRTRETLTEAIAIALQITHVNWPYRSMEGILMMPAASSNHTATLQQPSSCGKFWLGSGHRRLQLAGPWCHRCSSSPSASFLCLLSARLASVRVVCGRGPAFYLPLVQASGTRHRKRSPNQPTMDAMGP